MTPALTSAFGRQAETCVALGSPFMGQLLTALPRALPDGALARRLRAWPEDRLSARFDSVPLRLAGALHHLHLQGVAPDLTTAYPPHVVTDAQLTEVLAATMSAHEAAILESLESPPQTNEVRRAAVLIAVGHWLTALTRVPLVVSEIGASAGLNLNWDFFCLHAGDLTLGPVHSPVQLAPEWRGSPPT
ncbi:MAG: DUF2332 family protein, partial [Pseudomonadota bacterium]